MKIANGKCARSSQLVSGTRGEQNLLPGGGEGEEGEAEAAGEVVVQGLCLKVEQAMEPDLELPRHSPLSTFPSCGCRVVVMRV